MLNVNISFYQTSLSDLRTAGPELLKWDVHPFIIHKRACMPKLALQQVKGLFLKKKNSLSLLSPFPHFIHSHYFFIIQFVCFFMNS